MHFWDLGLVICRRLDAWHSPRACRSNSLTRTNAHACYFGAFHGERVKNFKQLASLPCGTEEEMRWYGRKKGIGMPKGVPTGEFEPGIAKIHDFSVSEDCDKTSSTQDRWPLPISEITLISIRVIAGGRRRGMPNHSTTRGQQSQRPMSFWTRLQNFVYRIVAKVLTGTTRKKRSGS